MKNGPNTNIRHYRLKNFQVLLEAQTVADLLKETEKDTKWIWYLLIGGIVLVGLIMLMGGD